MAEKHHKTLCKWKREDIKGRRAELEAIISTPRFMCGRCARSAAKKKWVCKPIKIGK